MCVGVCVRVGVVVDRGEGKRGGEERGVGIEFRGSWGERKALGREMVGRGK